jgi:hypothetical protein
MRACRAGPGPGPFPWLSLPARVRSARLRRGGLRLTLEPPAGARVVHIEISHARRGAAPGRPVVEAVRALRSTARQRLVLRGAMLHRLTPGRYVVAVRPGRAANWLAGATTASLAVRR